MALMRSARTGTCRMWEICCNRLAPMRLVPLLVFLHLLEREAERIAHFPWLIASILRRMRTRRPTCSSMGDGQVLRGEYSEIEQPVPERLAALVKKLEVRPPVSAQRRLAARIGPSLRRRA